MPASATVTKSDGEEARRERLLSIAIKAEPDFPTAFRHDGAYVDSEYVGEGEAGKLTSMENRRG